MSLAHFEWGLSGVRALRDRVAAIVIVDVLSFSTAVDIAVGRGAQIVPYPFGNAEAAVAEAARIGAITASPRRAGEQLSLSPASLKSIAPGTQLLLPSPNGSRLSLEGGSAQVFAGSFRNRSAVAHAVQSIGGDVAVIAAGERWKDDDSLRPAIEDLLGAGAVLDALTMPMSVEARVARDAFHAARADLADTIRASLSGRELIDKGFPEDVELAVLLDVSAAVPRLRDGRYGA